MRALTCAVAGPPAVQRDGYTTSSPLHSPANTARLRCSSSGVGAARWSAIGLAPLHGPDDLLAGVDIGASQSHHQRHFETDFLHRGDHALGNDITLHDAAENVDQDAL